MSPVPPLTVHCFSPQFTQIGILLQSQFISKEGIFGSSGIDNCYTHTFYLSQTPQTCLCKNFLSGVNFSRMSEKKCIYMTFSETFLVFLVILVVFLGVKFGFRKSCLCKRNDKYKVWVYDEYSKFKDKMNINAHCTLHR